MSVCPAVARRMPWPVALSLGLTALLLLLPGAAPAQKITSFETPEEVAMLAPSGLQTAQVKEHATEGQYSLRVQVKGSEKDSWPGLTLRPTNPDLSGYAILAYDVFVEGSAPVTISCRLDDAAGKSAFVSSTAKPGANTIELWLVSRKFDLDLRHVKSIFPYFRMPRKDATLYFDNFRFAAMAARFKAMVFEETNPPPEPSATDRERGYLLFSRPWLASIFPNSVPLAAECSPRLEVFGTPGQTVPTVLSVRSLQDLGETAVTVSDLRAGQKVVPAASVAVYPVSFRDKRLVYSSDYYIKDMPALLEQRPAVKIAAERTQPFWLNVQLPATAAPGVYTGTVTVTPGAGKTATVPLRVRVLPFKLSEPRHMLWGEYYLRPKLARTPAEVLDSVSRDLADQRAHGMTSVGLCFGLEQSDYKVEGTKVTVEPVAGGLYAHFMETYKGLGFPMPIIQLSDSGQDAASAHSFGSPEWVETYKNFWAAVARVHKERGWPEVIVQPVDEPGWQGPAERSRNVFCLKTLKEIPGQRTEQDGPGDGYFLSEAGPYADVWNFNGALEREPVLKKARAAGKILTSYNNDVESYRPEMDRYCNGFYQLRAGGRGTYNWAYISMAGNPYDDQDADTGSWMHVYPPLPQYGEVGGPSTGWEGARAGIDDYKYAYTLQRAIGRARASHSAGARRAARAAEATLAEILSTLDYSFRTRGTAAFAAEKPGPDGSKRVLGELKLPNGWDFANYDRCRWQLAAATMDVLAALSEVAPAAKPAPAAAPAAGPLLGAPHFSQRPADLVDTKLTGQKQFAVPVLSGVPAWDGKLDDPVWKQAGRLGSFTRMDGSGSPSQQTDALVYTDGQKLYLGVLCHEDNLANLTARIASDGGPVWQDDCLELFVDPTLQRSSFVQVIVNSLGKVGWNNPADKTWKPAVERGAFVDKANQCWSVELGIPLGALGVRGNAFGFNLCRERRPMESLELSCWSPTGRGFAEPQRFGVAAIGGTYLADFRMGRGVLGSNDLTVTLRNDDTRPHKLLAILDWKQGKRVALYRQKGPFELQPGQSQEVQLTYELVSDREPVALGVAVKDAETGVAYAQRRLEQQVLPVLALTVRPRLFFVGDTTAQLRADLSLSPALQGRAHLLVALFDGRGRLLRKQVLRADNDRLDAALNLEGLAAGTYRLECAVKTAPDASAPRLATVKTTLTKIAGPFD